MDNNARYDNPFKPSRRAFWVRIIILGAMIYLATIIAFTVTGNPNLFPTFALVGNFIIPVAFVAFFYERRNRFNISMTSTALSFIFGGVLGTAAAAILEPYFIQHLTFSTSFMVGFIEESTKLIGVLLIARRGRHTSGLDGIILGAAAGMGFAAFESTGYVFTYFLESGGDLTEAVTLTLIRGLIAPIGHGAWTAIIASVIFSASGLYGYNITGKVMGTFIVVAVLHGLWDGIPFVISYIIPSVHAVLIGQLTIGAVTLVILYNRWQVSRRELHRGQPA